jgi:hypothetical protein
MLRVMVSCLGLATSCVVIDPNAQLCAVGAEGCACTPGGACDPGLECSENECVDPKAPPETAGPGGTSHADSDDVAGTGSDTGIDIDTDTDADAGPNTIFVTSTTHTAALGGPAGADEICQARADGAGLTGEYRAWLSTPDTDARDRLGGARGWVRPDGKPFASDLAQIAAGAFHHPLLLDEHGAEVNPFAPVWTGTEFDGTALDAAEDMCGGWTTDDPQAVAVYGEAGGGPRWWTRVGALSCAATARLYCMAVDGDHELEVEQVAGRRAFISPGGFGATQGLSAADARCQLDADAAGLTGSFLALLATSGMAPADRFDLDGEPWVRVDGMPIFRPGQTMQTPLQTPLALTADGTAASVAMAWLGSEAPLQPGSADETCQDWSSDEGASPLATAWQIHWYPWSLDGGQTDECGTGFLLMCFEE